MTPSGRRRLLYSGRVQGVGFRWTTARIAGGRSVTGYVRNLPDGRVELVVDGNADDVEAFLNAVAAAFESHITAISEEPAAPDGVFSDFSIRR